MLTFAVKVLLNYIFVLACIALFTLPFYLVYRRKHPHEPGTKLEFNREAEYFFLSKQANYLVLFWALGEAIFWFVIPEFLLIMMIFMRIRRKKELLVYDIAGTLIGTTIALGMHLSNSAISQLAYIQPKMVEQTEVWYRTHGIWGLIYQPFSGVPYKVFTLTAHHYGFFLLAFLAVAIVVRMSRYVIFFGIFVGLYPLLHKVVYKNYLRLVLVSVFIFSLLLVRVVNIYGPNYQVHVPKNFLTLKP